MIQPTALLKKTTLAVALAWLCILCTGCSNKVQKAYMRGQEAQQALDRGDIPAARQSIAKAIQAKDDLTSLHLLNGKIELAAKSPATAFDAFVMAASLDPMNVEALEGIALTGVQSRHEREAEDAAQTLLAAHPGNVVALFTQGQLALEREQYDAAIAAANRILAAHADDERGVVLKVRALFLAGKPDAAVNILRQAEARPPSAGIARIALEVARARHDPAAMIKAFTILRRLNRITPQLDLDEANTRFKSGDRAEADRIVTAQLSKTDISADRIHDFLGLWREYGLPAAGAVRLPASANEQAREGAARLLAEHNRAAEALAILALAPSPNAEGIKSLVWLNQGQEQDANDRARQILSRDPTQCEARLVVARVALRGRRFDEAIGNANPVAVECPYLIDATTTLSIAYGAIGQTSQIERSFGEAIKRNRDNPRAYEAYATWLRNQRLPGRAADVARELTQATPSRQSAWRLLLANCDNDSCRAEARAGIAAAARAYQIDLPPGDPPVQGIYAPLPGSPGQ